MFTRICGVILTLMAVFLMEGCYRGQNRPGPATPVTSQVPVPNAYRLSTQQKMQAVHHWQVLANDVANIVNLKIKGDFSDSQSPIYVAPAGITVFDKGFLELLITSLVEKGLSVSNSYKDALVLSFDTQVVTYKRRTIRTRAGVYKSLAPGLFVHREMPLSGNKGWKAQGLVASSEVNVEAGAYTIELPEKEVMITLSLMYKGSYVMRHSSVYYINDPEWRHYAQRSEIRDPAVAAYKLVNK